MHRRLSWYALAAAATLLPGSAQTPDLVNNDKSVLERTEFDGRTLYFEDVNGRAVVEGDIVLGPVSGMRRVAPKKSDAREAEVTDKAHRWPGGVVPYVIDESYSMNPLLAFFVEGAIDHWQKKTSFRFVPREDQPNYVRFIAQDYGCWTQVASDYSPGMQGGQQLVNLDFGCFLGQTIHEIGHAVGLWHEQSRKDRDNYLQVRLEQAPADVADQFTKAGATGLDDGYYDYGSIMHYGSADFSITGAAVIASIPPGIQFGQLEGLSFGDIIAAERMNSVAGLPYVIATNPAGLDIKVDGAVCPYPCIVTWSVGSKHTLEAPSPQSDATPPKLWYFGRWNDDGARVHDVTADADHLVITANFTGMDLKDLPDLAVTALTAPLSGAAGQKLAGIRAEIRNSGGQKTGPFRVGFYISPSAAVTPDSVRLDGSCTFDEGLAAGVTQVCLVDAGIPESLPAGSYWVGAIADDKLLIGESNRKNNTLVNQAGPTTVISVAAGLPDLVVFSLSAPVQGVVGSTLSQVRVGVRNQGGAASGPFRIGYYFSKTPNIQADGIYSRWSCTVDRGLRPGELIVCTGDVQIRADLEGGTYIFAAIADDLRQVREADETNNIRVNDLGTLQLEKPETAPANWNWLNP